MTPTDNHDGQPSPAADARQAITTLVDAHGAKIYGLGLRMCGDPEAAQDLVQETFLNAYRGWEQFEGASKPTTWLYTIASRACQRMQRKRAGEPDHIASLSELLPEDEGTIPALPSDAEGPQRALLREEARRTVDRALGELPLDFRLPLVLKDIAGLSLAEIAAITGVKPATVKTRVYRARLKLRQAVAETLPERPAPDHTHPRTVCLDLLAAKQEALDRGAAFPVPDAELCERCQALFATLDLTRDACHLLGEDELPAAVRRTVLEHIEAG